MPTKILMVCLGNICRSPLAQGILESKLPSTEFIVDSAGTGGWHAGEKPDKRSIAVAKKYGIDISKQRARKFTLTDFDIFDYIYVMDLSNYTDIIALATTPQQKSKVQLLLSYSSPNQNAEVPDPYYGGVDGFEIIFKMIDLACDNIKTNLKAL